MGSYKKLTKLLIIILMVKCPNSKSAYFDSASMAFNKKKALLWALSWHYCEISRSPVDISGVHRDWLSAHSARRK